MSSRGLDPDGSGTLAIIYGLADGRTGVALATPGAPPPTESANFNGDDFVNAADLAAWTQDFGLPADAAHSQGDADYDLDVDGRDFLVWQRQFFPSPSSTDAAPVPEPAAACLAILAALATLPRIKPRRPR
jgi:hypothetical protein